MNSNVLFYGDSLTFIKPKVLIIDDETSNLKILKEILQDHVDVLVAKSGQQALKIVKKQQPTLILLDVVMSEMDGFEVIRHLKSNEHTHAIPVIFITGLSDVENEVKGFKLGACDYISKPFHPVIVNYRVKLHLDLVRQRTMLENLAHIDPLTSLGNRRMFDHALEKEWAAAKRNKDPIAILMIDIDFFKSYNDNYGHPVGDEVIQKVARAIKDNFIRPRDVTARYGGEEFIVILPNVSEKLFRGKVQKFCEAIYALNIKHEYSTVADVVTASVGGIYCSKVDSLSCTQAVEYADAQLYQAKTKGRNQVQWKSI
jgi:diguanylate cyclase (GGDEF)-like protein